MMMISSLLNPKGQGMRFRKILLIIAKSYTYPIKMISSESSTWVAFADVVLLIFFSV